MHEYEEQSGEKRERTEVIRAVASTNSAVTYMVSRSAVLRISPYSNSYILELEMRQALSRCGRDRLEHANTAGDRKLVRERGARRWVSKQNGI